ncbi:MAG TPA: YihA family ribosome biogenesis GTP-binding protein, partial [Hyphomicrobiaceae bacterium]|nr:YihA family ribosome biogenesis GTP-binding protein [Hyphomicrobiaceae bacterium]
KPPDLAMMELMDEAAVSYQAVLTKADKIKPHELARILEKTARAMAQHAAAYTVTLATSSQTGTGIPDLRAEIARLAAVHGALSGG